MKPGDHPEFFSFPPPAGRSRESTIVLDGEGRFWHDGALVEHVGMATAFARWVSRHPDDGRYVLTNGYDWTYFTVQDVPFFVTSVRLEPDRVVLVLSDGTEESLDPNTLGVGARDALYLRVKGGQFEARFSRSSQTALMPLLEPSDAGEPVLRIGAKSHRIGARRPAEAAFGPVSNLTKA